MLRDRLGKDLLIFDGAMGTQLQKAGLGAGDIPEELNIERPELLQSFTEHIWKPGPIFLIHHPLLKLSEGSADTGCHGVADRRCCISQKIVFQQNFTGSRIPCLCQSAQLLIAPGRHFASPARGLRWIGEIPSAPDQTCLTLPFTRRSSLPRSG